MSGRSFFLGALLAALGATAAEACAPAPMLNRPAVNADQAVIMIWDAQRQTQHFIRQASFKSAGADLGFLVPTPTQPELEEAGDAAFATLARLTAPEVRTVWQPRLPLGCGATCGSAPGLCGAADTVRVLEEKRVAGLNAVVLEAGSATALVGWLERNGYAYSPEIAAWAEPYIREGWKITALKVAKDAANKDSQSVAASALRISFHTSRPLFPYREPDMRAFAADLKATKRVLRIYFLAESRYEGGLAAETPWTGKVVWAGKVSAKDRAELLDQLHLPRATGPDDWHLTEFEDLWPYRPAPADVYFRPSADQGKVRRPPTVRYVKASTPADVTVFALAAALIVPAAWRRRVKAAGRASAGSPAAP
jgi:hypothetical protein